MSSPAKTAPDRRSFIGGSDARIIMGQDETALVRLWREKRGEMEPEDLSGNLVVQLGVVTEELNRRWYEANTGQTIIDVQKHVRHATSRWMAATLDGRVETSGAVYEAKFMLPFRRLPSVSIALSGPRLVPSIYSPLPQSHARASPVLFNKFYSCSFNRFLDLLSCRFSAAEVSFG
jgi:hypothetical protein